MKCVLLKCRLCFKSIFVKTKYSLNQLLRDYYYFWIRINYNISCLSISRNIFNQSVIYMSYRAILGAFSSWMPQGRLQDIGIQPHGDKHPNLTSLITLWWQSEELCIYYLSIISLFLCCLILQLLSKHIYRNNRSLHNWLVKWARLNQNGWISKGISVDIVYSNDHRPALLSTKCWSL